MHCKTCGTLLNEGEHFCHNCGAKIVDDNSQQTNNNYQNQFNNNYNQDQFTPNNSLNTASNYNDQLNANKNNNKNIMLGIIAIEIILVIVAIVSMFKSLGLGNSEINSSIFMSTLQTYGYNVQNVTSSYSDNSYIYEAYTASSNGKRVEYILLSDESYATSFFERLKNTINQNAGSITYGNENINIGNYKRYSVTSDAKTNIIVQKGNILLFAEGTHYDQIELNKIFTDLGCGGLTTTTFTSVVFFIICILGIVAEWKILEKAGLKGWYILIPFYNIYCLFKVAFGKGGYIFLLLVPFANFVVLFILGYKLSKAFGKSTLFSILSIFFGFITMQIIAFDDSKYVL